MNYKSLAKSMAPDVADYILINHKGEIKEMYRKYIVEFLNDKLGPLEQEAEDKLVHHLTHMFLEV